jgi:hypothetical protein
MSGPILKFEPRQTVNERLKAALEASESELRSVVNNEQVTRNRVDSIERVLAGFLHFPLKARLKWLLFGMPLVPKPEKQPETTGLAEVKEPDVH